MKQMPLNLTLHHCVAKIKPEALNAMFQLHLSVGMRYAPHTYGGVYMNTKGALFEVSNTSKHSNLPKRHIALSAAAKLNCDNCDSKCGNKLWHVL